MKELKHIIIFILLELLFTGMGMGVPFFLIIFGFFFGLFATKKILASNKQNPLKIVFRYSLLASGFSFLIMLGVWGYYLLNLFKSGFDIVNSGIPMILYEPSASLIGWMVLMIFISPFLQFLMAIFGSYIILAFSKKKRNRNFRFSS